MQHMKVEMFGYSNIFVKNSGAFRSNFLLA